MLDSVELNAEEARAPSPVQGIAAEAQSDLNAYFRAQAGHWTDVYQRPGVQESIYQERLRAVLAMVDKLSLPAKSHVLDVGCGAGFAAIALASRGLVVDALDPLEVMVETTRDRATRAGLLSRVYSRSGDIHDLPFPDSSFALVVALGVLPWVPALGEPLGEMTRVLRPGGHLIVTVDCLWQLRAALDPLRTPLLHWPKRLVRHVLQALGRPPKVRPRVIAHGELRRALAAAGLAELGEVAVGFGPFTFCGREFLPRRVGLWLEDRLQSLANRGAPILRWCGSQYVVLAKKPELVSGISSHRDGK
jgi:SAM-dependent methyltransferase